MRKRVLLCCLLFVLLTCIENSGRPSSARDQSPAENEKCGCMIVGLQGKAFVKLENSAKDLPLKLNATVFTGDLLNVRESSKVRLVCGEAYKEHEFTTGTHPVPCKSSDGPMVIDGLLATRLVDPARVRGAADPSFPRLLSPRKTKLLNAHPRLRWTPVTNATRYSVSVRGPNVDWSTIVTSTETVYPNSAPPLVAGQPYKVTIFAGKRNSDEESVLGLDFTILEAGEAQQVKARENEIKSRNLEDTSKRLLLANLYAAHGLNAEAIMQLDEGSNDQEVVRLLGELYLRTMLTDKAEAQYLRAVQFSGDDSYGQALAYYRLGQIYNALGKKDQAIQKYENAIKSFVDLKNWIMVREITEKLAVLQKR